MTPPSIAGVGELKKREGHDALWLWFGLSYAAFAIIPRVLMHEMPDEWQGKMAELLKEIGEAFPNSYPTEYSLRASENGKLVRMPEVVKNYRYPDYEAIERMK